MPRAQWQRSLGHQVLGHQVRLGGQGKKDRPGRQASSTLPWAPTARHLLPRLEREPWR
jgi:hypothetical protein